MLRIVPHTVPRVGRSYDHFPDGFEAFREGFVINGAFTLQSEDSANVGAIRLALEPLAW